MSHYRLLYALKQTILSDAWNVIIQKINSKTNHIEAHKCKSCSWHTCLSNNKNMLLKIQYYFNEPYRFSSEYLILFSKYITISINVNHSQIITRLYHVVIWSRLPNLILMLLFQLSKLRLFYCCIWWSPSLLYKQYHPHSMAW